MKPIKHRPRNSDTVVALSLLVLLALGVAGCTPMGIEVIPLSNREVLALSADDVVRVMRRAGFSDMQILEHGTNLRNGLAQSGAVQVRINGTVEAVFAVNREQGDCVYISTRLRGNFIYNLDQGWIGGGG